MIASAACRWGRSLDDPGTELAGSDSEAALATAGLVRLYIVTESTPGLLPWCLLSGLYH